MTETLLAPQAAWMDRAACADLLTDMFPSVRDPLGQARAKAVCRTCEVSETCRELGLTQDRQGRAEERWGIWGGLNGPQRGKLAGRRARQVNRRSHRVLPDGTPEP